MKTCHERKSNKMSPNECFCSLLYPTIATKHIYTHMLAMQTYVATTNDYKVNECQQCNYKDRT